MNLMVVIGMIPVTGVTLPFLSYGGSSLLITCASIGILLNISKYQMQLFINKYQIILANQGIKKK